MNENSEKLSTTPTPHDPPENSEGAGSGLSENEANLSEADLQKYDPKLFEEEQRNERRAKAYRMRLVDRMEYRQIAEALHVSIWTAHNDVKTLQALRVKELVERDKALVIKHDAIYEALLDKWLPIAISEDECVFKDGREIVDDRNLAAAGQIVKILQEQSKLHGLQASNKGGTTPAEFGREVGEHVLLAMQKLAHGGTPKPAIEAEIVQPELEDAKENP